jgi:GNAT superfamily N-acetyltransferase
MTGPGVQAAGVRAAGVQVAGAQAAGVQALGERQPGAGHPFRVRRAGPADREALTLMFERCTPQTRYRRFHGPVKGIPERYLADALSGSPFHYALVGYAVVGCPEAALAGEPEATRIVALASCRTVNEGAAELGVLIEDAWQRRGLGTRLIGDLAAHAAGAGLRVLEAQLLAEQAWIAGLLRPHGTCRLRSTWNGVLDVTVRLAP